MKKLLVVLSFFITSSGLRAQETNLITIKAGNTIKDVLKPADIYYFPQFVTGKVYFLDGKEAASMMNYNCVTDQMLFIAGNGDTMALDNEKSLRIIAFPRDTFYFNEGYLRRVADFGNMRLALREIWEFSDARKVGAFNTSSKTTEITSYTHLQHERGKRDDLILNQDLVLKKTSTYYVAGPNKKFKRADKKDLQILLKDVPQRKP